MCEIWKRRPANPGTSINCLVSEHHTNWQHSILVLQTGLLNSEGVTVIITILFHNRMLWYTWIVSVRMAISVPSLCLWLKSIWQRLRSDWLCQHSGGLNVLHQSCSRNSLAHKTNSVCSYTTLGNKCYALTESQFCKVLLPLVNFSFRKRNSVRLAALVYWRKSQTCYSVSVLMQLIPWVWNKRFKLPVCIAN